MYESYSRQAFPSKKYRELLGSAVCAFNSNNNFIIENILNNDTQETYNWHTLIDCTSGELSKPIKDTITKKSNSKIAKKFNKIIFLRNRIMHSFQATAPEGSCLSDDKDNQILVTKYRDGTQEYITEEFLYSFIRENEDLSSDLHRFRGH